MSNDLVGFQIPAQFILPRALLTPSEIAFGFEHGWINESTVVALALARYENSLVDPVTEKLALLLSDQRGQVREVLESIEDWNIDTRRIWLYLALAWIYEHRSSFEDVWVTIDMLAADFGNPVTVRGLIYYLPAPHGEATGLIAMEQRWRRFLADESSIFENRRLGDDVGKDR